MKKSQIVFLIVLLLLAAVTIDLGRNYFLALDPAINDGITCRSIFHIPGVFEPFGDHWTLEGFRLAFIRSLRLTLLVLAANVYLFCYAWWEKKRSTAIIIRGGIHMRKAANWTLGIALTVFTIDWGVMGVKLLDNNYDVTVEACIGAACFVVIIICCFIRIFTNKCPHCGEPRATWGDYCSYCGKKISGR